MWENNTRVAILFSVGAGMFIHVCFTMNVKVLAVCHNDQHAKAVTRIAKYFVSKAVEAGDGKFCPPDKEQRIEDVKPRRLKLYEEQQQEARKRMSETNLSSPATKRAHLADTVDTALDIMLGSSASPKANAPKPKPPGPLPPKPGSPAVPTPNANAAGTADAGPKAAGAATPGVPVADDAPTEDLAAMLRQWAA